MKKTKGLKDTAFSQSDQHPSTARCKLYQFYLPYQRPSRSHSFCLAGQVPVLWLAKRILPQEGDVESNPGLTSVCRWRGLLHWTEHPDSGHGLMDKPHQSDSFAGHVKGQIAGIAFGSVGALQTWEEGLKTTRCDVIALNSMSSLWPHKFYSSYVTYSGVDDVIYNAKCHVYETVDITTLHF